MNDEAARRQRLVKLGSATAFLAIVAVAVIVVVSQSGNSGGDAGDITSVEEVRAELRGIPQRGLVLGEPGAPVALVEFGDLQCPVCKGYAEEVLPAVIESQVRGGQARLEFRNFTILGPDSETAAAAAVAAGEQGRGWNFLELFYRNQGIEGTGYVTDDFLTAIAEAAGVADLDAWQQARTSKRLRNRVAAESAQAERLGFNGTPSFAVEGPAGRGLEPLGTPGSAGQLEAAIEAAS